MEDFSVGFYQVIIKYVNVKTNRAELRSYGSEQIYNYLRYIDTEKKSGNGIYWLRNYEKKKIFFHVIS